MIEIRVTVVLAAKNATSKTHPKDILHDKNLLYRIVLVHLTLNVAFKTRKHFQMNRNFFLKT